MPKSIREAMNRGNNLLMIVFLAVLSVGVIAELFIEPDLVDKADDAVIILLGIIGIIWYLRGRNRYQYSWVPFTLLAVGLLDKIGAVANELSDPASIGDEYGIVPTMVVLVVVSAVIMLRARRVTETLQEPSMQGAAIPATGKTDQEG